ncbi:MAG: imidazoleglycerol-phosphate dehydratase HisB [Oscillospiraceae bacterium]
MRTAEITRNTNETQITLSLNLDGRGEFSGTSGGGFLDHMLELFARHGRFDLNIQGKGDVQVDLHHLTEDTGITLGKAFAQALGEMRGIARYGSFLLPMDEALVMVALDISGRPHLGYELALPSQRVGDFDTELVEEFFLGFVRGLGMTLHLRQLAGHNTHHIIEAAFKGFGRAMAQAVAVEKDERFADEIPSTKGTIL